jgi:DNA-binding NtrC family response regulator
VNSPAESVAAIQAVLLVDDDALIRLCLAEYLRDCGYRVLEASNADEAVAILKKPDIQIDVVLSAVEMRGTTNGFGLANHARELRPGLEVILAGTAEGAAHEAGDLCQEGPMLRRPYDHRIVVERIKRLLAARGNKSK